MADGRGYTVAEIVVRKMDKNQMSLFSPAEKRDWELSES